MMAQSSYCWWRHHFAAATGSPYMVPAAASAGPASPSARAAATVAKTAVLATLAILMVFMVLSFSRSAVAEWLRKGSDRDLLVISWNSWSDLPVEKQWSQGWLGSHAVDEV